MPFYLDPTEVEEERSARWVDAVFSRAYCENEGVFELVRQRLQLGFSVLTYVPGSCMDAAARYIINKCGGPDKWVEYGNHPGPGKQMEDMWNEPGGLIGTLKKMFDSSDHGEPKNAVFKNLDRMFKDNNDGVSQNPGAQLALFSLIESTRNVITLGLVDREFGKLPDAVEAAFNERVWIREIAEERFPRLIPVELCNRLKPVARSLAPERLDPHVEWLLASRLRWSDPVRAALIMGSVVKSVGQGKVPEAIKKVWTAARPMEFASAESALDGKLTDWEESLPNQIVSRLKSAIIGPYAHWRDPSNVKEDSRPVASKEDLERHLNSLPPGVVLYGPAGTGKTLLARYIAKSIELPIRIVAGADLRRAIFGETERAIVEMFRSARRAAPCVLVLDDADDLLGDRQKIEGALAGAERAIVHTFLQELAGFGGRLSGVLVILTTNQFSGLDPAIRGRVPLHIHVPYPKDRDEIEKVMNKVALERRIQLPADGVRDDLLEHFEGPVIITPTSKRLKTKEDRAKAVTNQFSPREIHQAMLLLRGSNAGDKDGWYEPTEADVKMMKGYYQQLSESPEAEALAGI
jgi:hypothetical protein